MQLSNSKIKIRSRLFCLLALLVILSIPEFGQAQADNKVTLTISPPLIKVNMEPGQKWSSFIKVVNNNTETVKIYVDAQDFTSNDSGGAEFVPKVNADNKFTLSGWFEFNQGPIEIPAQQSQDVPFTINLPADASPCGHNAALLVGTKPPENITGSGIKVSSMLATLIMLDIEGDCVVKGEIQEFSTDKKFYDVPRVKFNVNINNTGNVNLQPRGEIKIYNFFNKESGTIDINKNTEYGNVLPQSNRRWEFTWTEKQNFFDMGRYKAVLFLNYGQAEQETTSQIVYFWIIYTKSLLLAIGAILLLVLVFTFLVKRYIRKAVSRAQNNYGVIVPPVRSIRHKISVIPDGNGVTEQKAVIREEPMIAVEPKMRKELSDAKKIFLATTSALVIVAGSLSFLYFQGYIKIGNFSAKPGGNNTDDLKEDFYSEVKNEPSQSGANSNPAIVSTDEKRAGEEKNVEILTDEATEGKDAAVTEPIMGEKQIESAVATNTPAADNSGAEEKSEVIIKILNGSGKTGVASEAQKIVADAGFKVNSIGNADNYDYLNTIIKYKAGNRAAAEKISGLISGQTELEEITSGAEDVVIIIGSSFK